MEYSSQPYGSTPGDFDDMHSFLKELYAAAGKPQVWEFCRLEFWKAYPYRNDVDFLSNNAQLWRDEAGKLAGIFIAEEGDAYFSILTHPDHVHLAEEMLVWAKENWGKDKVKLVTDSYCHSFGTEAILQAGFKEVRVYGNTRRYELEGMTLVPVLPVGFTIKCITEAPDYLGKTETMQRAYHPDEPLGEHTLYWRAELPSYSADLDLSVLSPEGKHVSFCYGFIDWNSGSAIIETVGTHPDYQQRGLGKAVITECFRRLREKGIKTAFITGYSEAANALYQSLQPVEVYPLTAYRVERE